MATDDSLSPSERIGFPDEYRQGAEQAIFEDILAKLAPLSRDQERILDIGPGSSDLPVKLARHCADHGHQLVLVDSSEMLERLPDLPGTTKVPGRFPEVIGELGEEPFDGVLAYSVLQHVFVDSQVPEFVEQAVSLLSHGGVALFGDIPNGSKLRRFLASPAGAAFHRKYTGRDEDPDLERIEEGRIDDALLLSLVERLRRAGHDAHLVPQPEALPLANRREDLLVVRP
jgi:SAM-dependent methyltransferase